MNIDKVEEDYLLQERIAIMCEDGGLSHNLAVLKAVQDRRKIKQEEKDYD